jgi:putative transposase
MVPEVAVHVVQRGHNRLPCFFRPSDYRTYLRYLARFAARYGCRVHAYCLMTNHVHMLITPQAPGSCAMLMKQLGQCYVQTVNTYLGRTGTLWEGRFRLCLVPSESYVLACYRYIELNPVRAGMVRAPGEYPWSSFLANAQGSNDPLISRHAALEAVSDYQGMFDVPLEARMIEDIRTATRRCKDLGAPRKRRGRPPRKGPEIGSVPNL